MKKIIIFLISSLSFISCQKVIDIDLEEGEKQLVIEANIDWKVQTLGKYQQIKLTQTTPFFYEDEAPTVNGATIWIVDEKGNRFDFLESNNKKGVYENFKFIPLIGVTYTLNIEYNGHKYTATDRMTSAPSKPKIVQKENGGLFGNNLEIRGYFEDKLNKINNFYIIRIDNKRYKKPFYICLDGKLFRNNQMFFIYDSNELEPKDTLNIKIYGVTNSYCDYFNQLLGIAQGNSGRGPFSTPPATIRGNIVDKENSKNNPLGAFRTTQFTEINYIVK